MALLGLFLFAIHAPVELSFWAWAGLYMIAADITFSGE